MPSRYRMIGSTLGKRRRVTPSQAVATAMNVGNWKSVARASRAKRVYNLVKSVRSRVRAMERTVETKEGCWKILAVSLPHNNLTVLTDSTGATFNPFMSNQGVTDPMSSNALTRIGDQIAVRGLKFKFFVEGSLGRTKVYFRFMLIRMAKGDTLNRTTFFKDAANNKMIDQYNRERFTIIAQKTFSVSAPNPTALTVAANGVPASATVTGITGNRIFTMWVPGKKFGRNGIIQYENAQPGQVKFFDYRLAVVAYDWYGTPQDVNNVGFINEGYVKVYFKDA